MIFYLNHLNIQYSVASCPCFSFSLSTNQLLLSLCGRPFSAGSVPSVGEDSLPCNPLPFSAEELDDGSDILYLSQATIHCAALVEGHGFGRFLGIEEWSIHWAGRDSIDAHSSTLQFLRNTTGKVLNRGLGPYV